MRVAFVVPEIAPFSQTGGLADVAASLPAALGALGAEVISFSPLYRSVRRFSPPRLPLRFRIPLGSSWLEGGVARSGPHYFIEQDSLYDREGLYGNSRGDFPDNAARFIFFCRGVLEVLRSGEVPDVIHVHDWPGGLIPVYLRTLYAELHPRVGTVFTVHNLAYQGLFPASDMALTGLPPGLFHWRALEFYGRLNFLKAGLIYADAVTTVSPTYAREIRTEAGGCGLHGVLHERGEAIRGILNGVDGSTWDPVRDPNLVAGYSAGALAGKAACKAALQRRCGLPVRSRIPLAGLVGRLAEQKGIGLFLRAAEDLVSEGLQIVVLGSGEERFEEALRRLEARHRGRVSVFLAFDPVRAHQVMAGCDLLLVPSLYEPCGLGPMHGLRYGTVPVVRATGGLADSVEDGVTGFAFRDYTVEAFLGAVRRALAAYGDPDRWRRMIRAGMSRDFGWEAPAREYLQVYAGLKRRQGRPGS